MYNTLRMLKPLMTPDALALELEELSEKYKPEKNPIYLAVAYHKVFAFIIRCSKDFFGLSEQDIASFSLQELDKCLQTFDCGQASFFTYYHTVLRNRLRTETQANNTDKRRQNFEVCSLDELLESKDFQEMGTEDYYSLSLFEILPAKHLTTQEIKLCSLIMDGFTMSDIAKMMGISNPRVFHIKNNIHKKVACLTVQL